MFKHASDTHALTVPSQCHLWMSRDGHPLGIVVPCRILIVDSWNPGVWLSSMAATGHMGHVRLNLNALPLNKVKNSATSNWQMVSILDGTDHSREFLNRARAGYQRVKIV